MRFVSATHAATWDDALYRSQLNNPGVCCARGRLQMMHYNKVIHMRMRAFVQKLKRSVSRVSKENDLVCCPQRRVPVELRCGGCLQTSPLSNTASM